MINIIFYSIFGMIVSELKIEAEEISKNVYSLKKTK